MPIYTWEPAGPELWYSTNPSSRKPTSKQGTHTEGKVKLAQRCSPKPSGPSHIPNQHRDP